MHDAGQDDAQPHHDAGHDAGQEHRRNRDRAAGHGVNDHDVRRRDDEAGRGRRRRQGRREVPVIAFRDHLRDHEAAHAGDRRARRAGDRPEEHARDRVGVCQAAGQMPDQGRSEIDQAARHAAAPPQDAGQDEERDGQKRERVDAEHHAFRDDDLGAERAARDGHAEHRRGADGDRDRDVQKEQRKEDQSKNQSDAFHVQASFSSSSSTGTSVVSLLELSLHNTAAWLSVCSFLPGSCAASGTAPSTAALFGLCRAIPSAGRR